jgi:hypothetical protein
MKRFCLAFFVFFIAGSSCKRDPEPEIKSIVRVTCANPQLFLLTQRGIWTLLNFNLGDVVAYNTKDKSLSVVNSITPDIVRARMVESDHIDTEDINFYRISNVEIEGDLDVATKAAVKAEVESTMSTNFQLTTKGLSSQSFPDFLRTISSDTSLMHQLSTGPYEETVIPDHIKLLIIDKVYYCKEVYLSDSSDKKVDVGGQVSVINSKVLKGKINVLIENSCHSLLESASQRQFKIIYGYRAVKFNKHLWRYEAIAEDIFK